MFWLQQRNVGEFVIDSTIELIGLKSLDFIIAFGLFFAIIYLGFSLTPFFSEDVGKRTSGLIAFLAAFSTAYYTYINNILVIDLIGSFALFLAVVLVVLGLIKAIAAVRQANTTWINLTILIGTFLLATGFVLAHFSIKQTEFFYMSANTLMGLGGIALLIALILATFF